ncbi:uncharacterized protein ALTATR162_LOCUS3323 [Alternaria atra]|uniref:BTB domain-containing protein n=1 Tax=Alternaria atra TaxID=119953 RepID=A0A8J2HWL4_9PLEO|nr:uncharacterized protein ALTATR162_LOCUS3323 [Alternaria atra]CAG5153773.1 unnamed protein product [Alternaria atra]
MSTTGGNAEIIAKKGDVILQLGKVGVRECVRKILVSSMVLSLASPVFATMFDGRFSEGQNLLPTSPYTVPLPDDDPQCIIMICKIGHMQTSQLPTALTAMAFFKLALVCKKYDCVDVVRTWAIIWVAELLENPATQDFEKIALAIHLLNLPNEFFKVSQSLIRDQSATFSIIKAMGGQECLPWTVYQCVLLGQMTYRQEISKAFGSIVTGRERCSASKQSICLFFHSLKDDNTWPINDDSVPTIKSRLKSVREVVFPVNRTPCSSHSYIICTCKTVSCIKSNLVSELDKIYNTVQGLCLYCVRHKALGERKQGQMRLPSGN